MNPNLNQDSVIYRLPNSEHIEYLISGEGNDSFVIAPFNKQRQKLILKGNIKTIKPEDIENLMISWKPNAIFHEPSFGKESYINIVKKAKQDMNSIGFKKVVLATRRVIKTETSLLHIFNQLLDHFKDAFVYVFFINGKVMIGATPEKLLTYQNLKLTTEALGGTLTDGVYSEKEWIEHQHIQSFIKDILESGLYHYKMEDTVSIKAGSVSHLSSKINIESKSFDENLQLAEDLHPTSAVCGLPFQTAFEFINKNEPFDRGFYSGYLGPIKEEKSFQFYVNLRCAEWNEDSVVLYAGAGINSLSNENKEWEEINNKMQTIAQWLK